MIHFIIQKSKTGLPSKPPKGTSLPHNAHRTPPAGYPKEPEKYAIPAEYKYPIDTEEHVRAAMSYFSKPANAGEYSKAQQKAIWHRIVEAAKKLGIEVGKDSGPPSIENRSKVQTPREKKISMAREKLKAEGKIHPMD